MGTLGLAWTGDLKNAGGVCEKNGVSFGYRKFAAVSLMGRHRLRASPDDDKSIPELASVLELRATSEIYG